MSPIIKTFARAAVLLLLIGAALGHSPEESVTPYDVALDVASDGHIKTSDKADVSIHKAFTRDAVALEVASNGHFHKKDVSIRKVATRTKPVLDEGLLVAAVDAAAAVASKADKCTITSNSKDQAAGLDEWWCFFQEADVGPGLAAADRQLSETEWYDFLNNLTVEGLTVSKGQTGRLFALFARLTPDFGTLELSADEWGLAFEYADLDSDLSLTQTEINDYYGKPPSKTQ